MNRLSAERRSLVLRALLNGASVRATSRMTRASVGTILKLFREVADACAEIRLPPLTAVKSVECDELHSFYQSKRNRTYVHTAICPQTKMLVAWHVGPQTAESTEHFLGLLKPILPNLEQVSTDGRNIYTLAAPKILGCGVHYVRIIPDTYGRRSVAYAPDTGEIIKGATTNHVEVHNNTIRKTLARFTRHTNAFSKTEENHRRAMALYAVHYNFSRPHGTLTKTNKGIQATPAMAAGLTDRPWDVFDILAVRLRFLRRFVNAPLELPKGLFSGSLIEQAERWHREHKTTRIVRLVA